MVDITYLNRYSVADMITCFEHLSNELLLDIFNYIDPRHLYYTFWNINSRLNDLILSVNNLQLIIDEEENNELITKLAPHIGLLQVNTWDDIDLQGFYNLYSLKLARPSSMQLKQIRADTIPNLIYLSLYSNVNFFPPKQLINDVFSNRFSYIRWARLGYVDAFDPFHFFQSLSLHYLHIGCYHTTMIPFVLASCPNLKRLHVDFFRHDEKIMDSPTMIYTHPLQQLILRDYCGLVSIEDIKTLITCIPNTSKIELKFHCNVSFISLVQYLSNSLSHLCRFDCYITESPIDSATSLTTIQQVHPCFSRITCPIQKSTFRVFDTQ
ncbi:unnamed protein product [Rotaria sp. Silwood2]|nr:unnamed protein product [Rotaria sp. Silwood2]CAF3106021.1 unnamed protein product [Rotaria sp. Silwood2]CAF4105975.1 unnamed protein product [Rotaria sp. Silwood2]CAF4367136.1 unnamed protein product [Rotaria sp. Silwood2]CAF4712724.1 unnamed protein product [Rotaria sp. Silwood2]